jgi:L-threonylcarbamoyladenylate synthase
MAEYFELASCDHSEALTRLTDLMREGEIVVLPLEHGYVYAVDAFNQSAVNAMHSIKGNEQGTSAQVLIADSRAVNGLAQGITDIDRDLIEAFWPGLLTLYLTPQTGLIWDLGDAGTLNEFALRIPHQPFVRELIRSMGPIAITSAGTRNVNEVTSMALTTFVDGGELPVGARSTIVQGNRVLREGAIPLSEIARVAPNITLA